MKGFRERRMAKGRRDPNGGGFLRGAARPTRARVYRTPEQRELTWRRSERTRRANSILSTIQFCQGITDTALPFWCDQVLKESVVKLVRLVRQWGWWSDAPPPALAIVPPPSVAAIDPSVADPGTPTPREPTS